MRNYFSILFTLAISVSCSNDLNNHNNELIQVVEDSNINPIDCLSRILNIDGIKKDSSTHELGVSRTLLHNYLYEDTLKYQIIKDDWYTELPPNEENIEYYCGINLFDIDTSDIKTGIAKKSFYIMIKSKEKNKIFVSKVSKKNAEMINLWTIYADSIYIDFPIKLDLIREKFLTYRMYNPATQNQIDYCETEMDSIRVNEFINHTVESIKKQVRVNFKNK